MALDRRKKAYLFWIGKYDMRRNLNDETIK